MTRFIFITCYYVVSLQHNQIKKKFIYQLKR